MRDVKERDGEKEEPNAKAIWALGADGWGSGRNRSVDREAA
jgi:hypothetical protein